MDKKPTLAIVSDAIFPYSKGGKETRIRQLSTRLAQRGWDVHIYTMHWWKSKETARVEEGVTLHAISPLFPLYSKNRRSIRQGIRFGVACLKLLRASFDLAEVDSMPYFPVYAMRLICRLKGRPLVATWHEVWPKAYWKEYLGDILGSFAFRIEKYAARLPDVIIAVSKQTANQIHMYYSRTQRVHLVESGIDTQAIEKIKPAREKFDAIFAGRLLSHKRVDVLLEAFKLLLAEHPKLSLSIIGDGPEKPGLVKLAKTLGIAKEVAFSGFVKDIDSLYGAIKSSSVFVLPSSREGFGLSVLEANACGIPAVTVDHPQNYARKLVIPGKSGEVTKLDPKKLAKTIAKVLAEHTLYRDGALENAKGYDWEKQTDMVEHIYTALTPG